MSTITKHFCDFCGAEVKRVVGCSIKLSCYDQDTPDVGIWAELCESCMKIIRDPIAKIVGKIANQKNKNDSTN